MSSQSSKDIYDNGNATRLRRGKKVFAAVQELINHPAMEGSIEPWWKKSFDDYSKSIATYTEPAYKSTHELELRMPSRTGSNKGINCRLTVAHSEKRLPPAPDGSITGIESMHVTVSFSGLYNSTTLLETAEILGWMTMVNNTVQSIATRGTNGYEEFLWRDAEQARRTIEKDAAEENMMSIRMALERQAKGARIGKARRLKGCTFMPGHYANVMISTYKGKVIRTYDVDVYADGTGYFVRKS